MVNYAAEVARTPSGPALLRCILLLWTGIIKLNQKLENLYVMEYIHLKDMN